jgi:hypothetical protein
MTTTTEVKKDYILNREEFVAYIAVWKEMTNSKTRDSIGPELHMLHNILRNLPAERGFTPITNPVKLANGREADRAFATAKTYLNWVISRKYTGAQAYNDLKTLFKGTLTDDTLAKVKEKLG